MPLFHFQGKILVLEDKEINLKKNLFHEFCLPSVNSYIQNMTKQTILNTIITVVPKLNRHSLSSDIYTYDVRDFLLRGRSQSSGHDFCFPETSDPGPVSYIGSVFPPDWTALDPGIV